MVNYDIGANDEPNGHGTVTYKKENILNALGTDAVKGKKLLALLSISNLYVGDSIANMLLIEAILYDLDMSIQDFAAIYEANPSLMYKVKVNDRTQFKTIEDESRLKQPLELQEEIDKAILEVDEGKAFVRPSGTEDVLRIYAEASTQ